MKVIRRTPDSFNQLFDSFFRDEPAHWLNNWHQEKPVNANIYETENAFEIALSVPGFQKDQIKIELNKGLLEIKGEVSEHFEEENLKIHRREFRQSSFERRFRLPENKLMEDEIKAHFENGILRIVLPKDKQKEQAEQRLIEIH